MNDRRLSNADLDYQGRHADPMWRPSRAEKVVAVLVIGACVAVWLVALIFKG